MMRSEIRNILGPRGELWQDEAQWKKLVVTHVENPCTFCAQDCLNKSMIQVVIEQVNYYGCRAPRLSSRPEKEKIYVARYNLDGNWYRCKVKSYTATGAKVLYLDFGNTSSVALSEIAHLPPELQRVPPLCQKYRLEGVKPAMAVLGEAKHNEGKKWLMSFTRGQIVSAYAYRKPKFYAWIADCWVNDVNLSSRVLSMGFALPNSEFPGAMPMGMMRNGVGPPMVRKMPVPTFPIAAAKKGMPVVVKRKEAGRMGNQSRAKSPVAAKNEKTMMQKRIKALEREVKGLQAAKVTPMVKNIVPLIGRGAKLHDQYTGGGEEPVDNLLDGLKLLDGKIEDTGALAEELKDVEEKETKLKEAQKEIKDCKEKSELESKILARNKLRKQFYETVKIYLEKGRHVKERHDRLKGVHDAIHKTYSYILAKGAADTPAKDMDSAVEAYKKWKEDRKEALGELHKNVGSLRSTTRIKLTELAAALEDDDCDLEALPDVDGALVELKDAARKEAKCMLPDKEAVGGLARAVKTALRTEMDGITTLANAHAKYNSQAEDMEKWLNTSPDVEGVRDYERELKALRSRMRRKLVDLMDEEEESKKSEEGDGIKGIKEELGAIRIQSQDMEKKMSELKRIMNEHFPELSLLHPELNLTDSVLWSADNEENQTSTSKKRPPVDDEDRVKTQLAELREELERMTEDD